MAKSTDRKTDRAGRGKPTQHVRVDIHIQYDCWAFFFPGTLVSGPFVSRVRGYQEISSAMIFVSKSNLHL